MSEFSVSQILVIDKFLIFLKHNDTLVDVLLKLFKNYSKTNCVPPHSPFQGHFNVCAFNITNIYSKCVKKFLHLTTVLNILQEFPGFPIQYM